MSKTVTRVSGLVIAFSLFQVGSTTLFLLGATAKQDAWLAMMITVARWLRIAYDVPVHSQT
ncbi:hypothetical protein [Paenibacillus sp. FSL K6-2862]|uniref:hypothetical protein n=1 Tax=Paenibacillus sp. FSL K6-2862 TaxID=2921484 RepID=UPI0030F4EB45